MSVASPPAWAEQMMEDPRLEQRLGDQISPRVKAVLSEAPASAPAPLEIEVFPSYYQLAWAHKDGSRLAWKVCASGESFNWVSYNGHVDVLDCHTLWACLERCLGR